MLVSIIIPTYEQPDFLADLLTSILSQNYVSYEVIVTDDSRSDRVREVCELFADERILYFKNSNPLGSPKNWNEGMRKSSGDIIKIMHHDDQFLDADSLGAFVELLDSSPSVGFAFCGSLVVSQHESRFRGVEASQVSAILNDPRNIFLGNIVGAPSATIFRRSTKLFDENLIWLVDLEFYMRLIGESQHCAYTHAPLVAIGIHNRQITNKCINDRSLNISEHTYVYQKHRMHDNKRLTLYLWLVLVRNMVNWGELAKEFSISFKLSAILAGKLYYLLNFILSARKKPSKSY